MKEVSTYKFRCNFCGELISDQMRGQAFWWDKKLGRYRTRTHERFEDHDIHLHNKCHLDLVWLYPGGRYNPAERNDEGERDCKNCGYLGISSNECVDCEHEDINGTKYYPNWQAKTKE